MNNEAEVRLVYGSQPDFVVWRNSTGFAERDGRPIRFGLAVGSSDLIGMAPGGLFLAVECKLNSGRLSDGQRRFLELVYRLGGVAVVCRSADEARIQVQKIRAGERKIGWN